MSKQEYQTKKANLLPDGTPVLIDLFWTYTDNKPPTPRTKGKIMWATNNQYYVSLEGGMPQYVWHGAVKPI